MPIVKDMSYRFKEDKKVHEFRYRRNGIEKSFSSKDYKKARKKALNWCREQKAKLYPKLKDVYLNNFADNYLNNVKKKNVTEKTFLNDYNAFNKHIIPEFDEVKLKDVKAPLLQEFLNKLIDQGYGRTAERCFYILKQVLDYAVNLDEILKNPMNAVKIPIHTRNIGKALPIDLERKFVKAIQESKHKLIYLTLLYTGCRPCELESLKIEKDGFFTLKNAKQKNNVLAYKDIPITPMIKPYVEEIKKALPLKITSRVGKNFRALCPGYNLYSLRHTFATRCQTCGVPQEIVARWMGHSTGRITDYVYSHFPPDYMQEQAKKVEYN